MMNRLAKDRSGRSPWAGLDGVEQITVMPATGPIIAALSVPGSKSLTNRVLLLAAVAEGRSVLSGILRSDDSYWCLAAIKTLGISWMMDDGNLVIHGCAGRWPNRSADLYLGSAGTLARFLPGLLAASEGTWHLSASDQLSGRPLQGVTQALREWGAGIDADQLPLNLTGRGLTQAEGEILSVSGATSSQFLSGLLMAAPLGRSPVRLQVPDHVVQADYVRITLDCMERFGVSVDVNAAFDRFSVRPQSYRAAPVKVEADASTATYFLALAAATGGQITINNLGRATRQPDFGFVHILERMGARIDVADHRITLWGPPKLKGGFDADMRALSDAALTLAAIAPFADAPIRIANVAHIRHHESDRIAEICRALTQSGITVHEHDDGLTVYPGSPRPAILDTADDHRLAMALSVMAVAGAGATLRDPGCVSKTCPIFFDLLAGMGIVCHPV